MITSTSSKQLKAIVQLNKKAKIRRKEGHFVAEGLRIFQDAPRELIEQVYVSEHFWEKEEHRNLLHDYPYEVVADHAFASVCDTKTPQGILSIIKMPTYEKEALFTKASPLFMILEDLQDPGNLGTILRGAEGAGVDGVIMTKQTADLFQPKVIRSTMGSIFRMPYLIVEDLQETLQELKERKIKTYAAYLDKSAADYGTFSYEQGTAFVIGNEGNGLKEETAKAAQERIMIPMHGSLESLNAAMAATILMYEAARQRR
ncbi:TrmH family RNA methyltransferase [Eubacterium oxidoreducens]|uniref:RNA methyltransferase, TrmH family n=1 Tax=Eubacterium oxidoreducens TaxID=1732 RepID=A0A1G6AGK2_EUBOX|nr:RNA methyltransferase [Eubacterium oxidoreducens]SDB07561.1 RNA methyltransferase, TrmH family [Eubacterium oxidoreducens]